MATILSDFTEGRLKASKTKCPLCGTRAGTIRPLGWMGNPVCKTCYNRKF